ncbi:3-deoxy-D-manno-octulosonic acid transferase [uncultured Croceitalea sp.]|uniref:3-deoxy-D-manno-octulosonic acid transferase n=1 Tax=uncultured Croceitalea sp. TaxID=1798908 RepID=UPI00374EA422
MNGRKNVLSTLKKSLSKTDKVIWMHVASLGEYEQGLPILEKLRENHPKHKILLTFFSPSGFEVKKNSKAADIITYLPLDTISNASKFIALVKPEMALFIKYEIWPNYLNILKKEEIPTFLISALFSKKQIYFKWYGGFMRKNLMVFNHFFLQDENSKQLLKSIGIPNTSVTGDTRFDRVSEILSQDNTLDFMDSFKENALCFVVGSSWPEDEELIIDFINSSNENLKYVIAPHNIKHEHISRLKVSCTKKTLLYSEITNQNLADYKVLIIDTIGLLTKIYSYADIAYVGGGFKTGLHNTLEPAVFGIPIMTGPNYQGFKEAEDLVCEKGILISNNKEVFNSTFKKLVKNKSFRESTGTITKNYVSSNTGATIQIMRYLQDVI